MGAVRRLDAGMAVLAVAALLTVAAHVSIMAAGERHSGLIGTLWSVVAHLPGQIRRADPAAPDFVAGLYGGYTATADSDLRLSQPGGTDMTIKDVHWGSEPDEMPPYHGFRGTWWLPFGRSLGLMGDLVYIKAVADRERTVHQSGTRDGQPVPESEPLSATFRRLEFTDGLNLATVNAVYRLPFLSRVRPYIGIGAGASLPHAEVRRTGAAQRTFEFQLAGYVVQIFAGIEFRLAARGSVFTEYRASYATNNVKLVDGGTLRTNLLVNHFSAGGLGHLRPATAITR